VSPGISFRHFLPRAAFLSARVTDCWTAFLTAAFLTVDFFTTGFLAAAFLAAP
jgi:hypothetical protein